LTVAKVINVKKILAVINATYAVTSAKCYETLRDAITEKVESNDSSGDKMEFLAGLANFIHDKPSPLDGSAENSAPV